MDAAMPAKIMLRGFRVELIQRQVRFAREDAKVRFRCRVPERALAMADRAVAIDDVAQLGLRLEGDPTAMARAAIGFHLRKQPSVTSITAPLTIAGASSASQRIASATSSGRPLRFV